LFRFPTCRRLRTSLAQATVLVLALLCAGPAPAQDPAANWSVARQWNEELLEAIRHDFARPTVHARNLYHVSAAMWDAWAAYDRNADAVFHDESLKSYSLQADREEAISYAAYRLLSWRFAQSPGVEQAQARFDALMDRLGYDRAIETTTGNSPAALGNRIAQTIIEEGLMDGSNEQNAYANLYYKPVNPPLLPILPGNPDIVDPNRWQPLALKFFIDQAGRLLADGSPKFLSPEWGNVIPFALGVDDLTVYERDGHEYLVWHDPGPPPHLGGERDQEYKDTFARVAIWSGLLDPTVGGMIDISPAGLGQNHLGTNDGHGWAENPRTGLPYEHQWVPAGDYYRVLAEFWADGPASETPPGHWFTIANTVADSPHLVRRVLGQGPEVDPLEWDVKVYLTLGGAMHDAAISAWSVKGWYDFVRPVSAIRFMCDNGQSSDPQQPSYDIEGIPLKPGSIEVITGASAAPGQRHEHIAGNAGEHIGKIALYAWRGPDYIADPTVDEAGVDWIRCEDWWPYQRPTFVTPPFAGYVSGHSTYSRTAAEVLTALTGDAFFPGGLGEFHAPRNEFLVFEEGPSTDLTLQWATYGDAADECSLSRIYGGIHPPADDIPGRLMGVGIAADAVALAVQYFNGEVTPQERGFPREEKEYHLKGPEQHHPQ